MTAQNKVTQNSTKGPTQVVKIDGGSIIPDFTGLVIPCSSQSRANIIKALRKEYPEIAELSEKEFNKLESGKMARALSGGGNELFSKLSKRSLRVLNLIAEGTENTKEPMRWRDIAEKLNKPTSGLRAIEENSELWAIFKKLEQRGFIRTDKTEQGFGGGPGPFTLTKLGVTFLANAGSTKQG